MIFNRLFNVDVRDGKAFGCITAGLVPLPDDEG